MLIVTDKHLFNTKKMIAAYPFYGDGGDVNPESFNVELMITKDRYLTVNMTPEEFRELKEAIRYISLEKRLPPPFLG